VVKEPRSSCAGKRSALEGLNTYFISHLHGDHFYGLIGLISTFNLLGLKNDIHVYSPSQLKDIIQPQLDFLKGAMQFKVIFHPLNFKKPEVIYEDRTNGSDFFSSKPQHQLLRVLVS
jgi:ribonuclease BN (tRNA processing enzyme)